MSIYLAQADLATDQFFTRRVASCVQTEIAGWEQPPELTAQQIASQIMPAVATSPGFAESYLWGDEEGGAVPGQGAIDDSRILSAVQPMLEPYRPA